MYDFKRIMVALDFSSMDETLLNYTSFLVEKVQPEKIYFINVQKEDPDLPEELLKELESFKGSRDEQIEEDMRRKVIEHFPKVSHYNISYEVEIGDPLKELLKWTHVKDIDLVIAGRKKAMSGSGLVVQLLARKVRCSLLLVPEVAQNKLEKVMVPTDFSENSKMAVEALKYLSQKFDKINTTCQHVFTLPMGYYSTGKTEEEFVEIMKGHAQRKYDEFIKEVDMSGLNPQIVYSVDNDKDPSDLINEEAHNKNVDMVVIGARGRTDVASFLLGSKTEKLIARDTDIPLLIVKSKKHSFDFFDALRSI